MTDPLMRSSSNPSRSRKSGKTYFTPANARPESSGRAFAGVTGVSQGVEHRERIGAQIPAA